MFCCSFNGFEWFFIIYMYIYIHNVKVRVSELVNENLARRKFGVG